MNLKLYDKEYGVAACKKLTENDLQQQVFILRLEKSRWLSFFQHGPST
ncbi:MAG: hypothetical protein IPK31_01440 [Chitinophagaceae bacterium]|nr:hypothetical protein [Chitinophagaceae bacterium]